MNTVQQRARTIVPAGKAKGGGPILYWMCRDQRVHDNWALLYAQQLAKEKKLPFGLVFCLSGALPYATARHHDFMIKGLQNVVQHCNKLNVPFWLLPPETGCVSTALPKLTKELQSATIVTDIMPLRYRDEWIEKMKAPLTREGVEMIEVDAHNVVPLWVATEKQEWAARTIRPKITSCLPKYLTDIPSPSPQSSSVWPPPKVAGPKPLSSPDDLKKYTGNSSNNGKGGSASSSLVKYPDVKPVTWITPGEDAGKKALAHFIASKLKTYHDDRNQPCVLSPYFHFGHLSPQRAAYDVKHGKGVPAAAVATFIEESVVRAELSDNFTHYNPHYDSPEGMPDWAMKSLKIHDKDKREYLFTEQQLEDGKTHDDLWNAAQLQLVHKGHMHGYVRMYWAKKILEWTPSSSVAFRYAMKFNDKYSLDGNDPKGFVGVSWSMYGVHDRAWTERTVFGKIRYMNYAGCKRKFDIPGYITRVTKEVTAEGISQKDAADMFTPLSQAPTTGDSGNNSKKAAGSKKRSRSA